MPSRPTRKVRLFDVPYARVGTVKAGIFIRLATEANDFISRYPQVDFLSDRFITVKAFVEAYCRDLTGVSVH